MKQAQFEQLYGNIWREFETIIEKLEENAPRDSIEGLDKFGQNYRKVCHFHALAKQRHYSSLLVDSLAELTVRGHSQLYRRKYAYLNAVVKFVVQDFPTLVRREWKIIGLAHAVLYLPALLLFMAIVIKPELVYTVMSPVQVSNFEDMYNPSHRVVGSAREAKTNWYMFGFYINNNIGVSFRTFASGIIFCVGSLFFLGFNGLLFGAASAHMVNVEYSNTFFTFVVAHGSFELTAIAISGAAGMKLGWSILNPGNLTRLESLKRASADAIKLMYGVILMLLIAAFIEAFWSSNNMFEPWQKYTVGAALWLVVIAYLGLSGRSIDYAQIGESNK